VKIHLACGRHYLDGWVNCDLVRHPKAKLPPDVICDVSDIPLSDGIADELLIVHILEHFYQWETPKVLAEWARLLRSGGKIVIEMPDVIKAAKNLIKGHSDQMAMWPLYGDQTLKDPLMCHKWGWSFNTIKPLLEQAGFRDIVERDPEWHGRKINRDFRVEAIKC
jgi:predicted SAM-dependent methyltransferase